MGHVGPSGKKPTCNFLISLGITEILGFSDLSVYTEVVLLKTYLQHFELCLFANIEKVMKFYNLGDKTFETDLSSSALSQNITIDDY